MTAICLRSVGVLLGRYEQEQIKARAEQLAKGTVNSGPSASDVIEFRLSVATDSLELLPVNKVLTNSHIDEKASNGSLASGSCSAQGSRGWFRK